MTGKEIQAIEALVYQTLKPSLMKLGKAGIDIRNVTYTVVEPDSDFSPSTFVGEEVG